MRKGFSAAVLFLLFWLATSCNQKEQRKQTTGPISKVVEAKGYLAPQESLKPPQVVLLADRPKPLTIEVPVKPGGSYVTKINNIETKVELQPPKTQAAGFLYLMQNYTTNDGLALDTLYCGLIDRKGNIWFGTNGGGVSRYDGKNFTNYTTAQGLVNNVILSMLEDKTGNLWFGTQGGGVSRYDGNIFTTYTTKEGLIDNIVRAILEDSKGNLWFGTEEGVCRFEGNQFTTFTVADGLAQKSINTLLEDKMGELWFGTKGGGLSRYDGSAFVTFTTKEGLPDNAILSSLMDNKGNLWFGTEKGGVCRYDGKSFEILNTEQGLASNTVWSVLEDKAENLWFGTNHGASGYDGKSFTNLTTSEGLASNDVRFILADKTGNLWFGTFGGGVSRFEGKFLTAYTVAQGLASGTVRSIVEDKKGNLWFGTQGGGISEYNGKSFTTYTMAEGLSDNNVRVIFEDKAGNLWIGTYEGGVSRFDGKSFTTFTTAQGLASDHVYAIQEDKAGRLWFATNGGGVSRFDGKSFTNFTTAQGLPNNHVWGIHEDKAGQLWFATFGGGVSRYDGKSFTTYTTAQGLANDAIFCILEDSGGNLWFGSDGGGVSRFDGKSFLTYTTTQGLPDNVVYQLAITPQETIAMGTNAGVGVLTGFTGPNTVPAQNKLTNEALQNYKPLFEIYNTKTGYPLKDANGGQQSMLIDSKGILWMGTGPTNIDLVRLDFSALNKNTSPPEVYIQAVKVNNENVIWNDLTQPQLGKKSDGATLPPNVTEEVTTFGKPLSPDEQEAMRQKFGAIKFDGIEKFYPVPQNLVLPHDFNNITLDFAAIEPAKPENVLYQYILEGYDKEWSPPSNDTRAVFGNIYEGTYPFKVRAESPYGVWSEPITYTFKVLPPWYRTWWAYLFYAVSSLTAIYSYIQWRTAKLRRQFEQMEELYHSAERFLPKPILQLLNRKHFQDVQLGDNVKLKITVMFADIRGFTTIAESFSPEQTTVFLNTYMRYMAPLIRDYKGFVNQFLGDGILALFPETPSDSVDAALAMTNVLPRFNQEIQEKGFSSISLGIGINTGDAMLCALGEKERMEPRVISDVINTASRVEGLNKLYKTQILISEWVYQKLSDPNKYLIRQVDKVKLKGKTIGSRIYEVKSLPEGVELENERLYYALYADAFALYEKGDFSRAEKTFKTCLEKKPDDAVVKLLLDRCLEFRKTGTPPDWDGTVTLTEK